MKNVKDIAVIISTFDGAKDLWKPLELTYKKFWADCSFPIYLTTNYESPLLDFFSPLTIGKEMSWSDNLIKSLMKIEQEYVLLTFDDLFLIDKVDDQKIKNLMNIAIDREYNYLQFYRSISGGKSIGEGLFKKSKAAKYKNSTIWSFWKKEVLISLLKEDENAWEFEIKGNIRSAELDSFYSTKSNMIPFVNGVIKGVWNPIVKSKIKNLGIELCDSRKSLSFLESIKYQIRYFQFDVYTYIIRLIY
jgi:hypothetical protein